MGSYKFRALFSWINLLGYLAVVAINWLAVSLPLGGKTTGRLSDQYPNLFVPAGLTFSIWGLIYLLLAIYVVFGIVRAGKVEGGRFADKIGALFLLSCAANVGWIFSWHYEILPLSLFLMGAFLVVLCLIYMRLDIGRSQAGPAERYLVHLPFSVYLGWISVATVANTTALLVAYRWNRFGLGEEFWAVAMILVCVALGAILLLRRGDIFYTLVLVWAFIGIVIKRTALGTPAAPWVVAAALAGIALLSLGVVVQLVRRKVYRA